MTKAVSEGVGRRPQQGSTREGVGYPSVGESGTAVRGDCAFPCGRSPTEVVWVSETVVGFILVQSVNLVFVVRLSRPLKFQYPFCLSFSLLLTTVFVNFGSVFMELHPLRPSSSVGLPSSVLSLP